MYHHFASLNIPCALEMRNVLEAIVRTDSVLIKKTG